MSMQFIDDKISTICENLRGKMIREVQYLDDFRIAETGYKRSVDEPKEEAYSAFVPHSTIGGIDKHYKLVTHCHTPEKKEGHELFFSLTTGREGQWDASNPQVMLFLNGKIEQGLDTNHTRARLEYDTDYLVEIYLYTGMNGGYFMFEPSVVEYDKRIEKLYYDLHVPLDACKVLNPKSYEYITMLKSLELAVSLLDLRDPGSEEYYAGIEAAEEYLEKNFYNGLCGKSAASVSCIGHTHIDVAWLWTLEQTREKAQRSFATVLSMMEEYPEYIFMSSQPQLYKYVKQDAPELYERIKKAVADGRWEVEGAMWLEADCNLSSGESLTRQIMHGKRFMKEEFGVNSTVLWLPDVFGYSIALPQILKKSGVKKFVTSKISWNESNKLPYDSFIWEGIDGSEIFTYFITARDHTPEGVNDNGTTYVGYIRPSQVLGTWERYQQKEYNNETLITFGFGDGGGGPTRDMLEQQRRLAAGLPGFPSTKIEKVGDFLDRVETNFDENRKLLKRTPRWVGELYLEYHRGTYTSIAKNKKNNRKSEQLFEEAEKLAVTDMLLCGGSYPAEDIYDAWETILLNQFHDIIPGSSIFEVYEECDREYAKIRALGEKIKREKLESLASRVKSDGGMFIYNPHSFKASGVVDAGDKGKLFVSDVPAMGWKVIEPEKEESRVKVTEKSIENSYFNLEFDENGNISRFTDKRNQREVLREGELGNQIEAFEDIPRAYDNWEITSYYKQKKWFVDSLVSSEKLDEGARAGLKLVKRFKKSTITQNIWLYNDTPKVDFETSIDWNEEHILLKAAFPVDVHTDKATYDVQFGNVERPTHMNTSWDAAKFEVCAHKWADIADGGYGMTLMNDCKYGYSAEGSTLKLTLLRCGTYPNPYADKGHHEFIYSVYPHEGSFKDCDAIEEAYLLNTPLEALSIAPNECGEFESEYSFISCNAKNIKIETVKKAEDSGDIIVRAYEDNNKSTLAELMTGFDFNKAYYCDLMENVIEEIKCEGRRIPFKAKNFEIVTIMIKAK